MRVAVVGSGGREHALTWKIAESARVTEVLCLPGNPGTAGEPKAVNLPCAGPDWIQQVEAALRRERPDLVVVGPEVPLVDGLADRLRREGLAVVGPGAAGARLEGSKEHAKSMMRVAGIPTGRSVSCATLEDARRAIHSFAVPPVIKADGLAAGKGVTVAASFAEAMAAAEEALVAHRFGSAGDRVLVEERLEGVEASYIVLTDGHRFVPLPTSQDHKRLLDGDRGPNTGGMGAYVPNPHFTEVLEQRVAEVVIEPLLRALRAAGTPYRGFLYAGLMLTPDGPKVLEFNVRSGDPETQPILFGLQGDLLPLLEGVAAGRLEAGARLRTQPAATVVLAAEGYPDAPGTGVPVEGLDEAASLPETKVFHAGTRRGPSGRIETAGGRVLGVTARGDSLDEALARAYGAVDCIRFAGRQLRRDIGAGAR